MLPFLRQFEQSKRVTREDCFNEYPKCYWTVKEEFNECLLLEDLSVRGFQLIDRHSQEVTADHVRLVLQALGEFHAVSFALKDQQPDKFNHLVSELKEIFIKRENSYLLNMLTEQPKLIFDLLSAEEDADLLTKMRKVFEKNAMDIAIDCLETNGSASVITHGDTWQNNILFKYDEDSNPIESCLLDWQVSRVSSPIIDLVYFIFTCTTKELREAHYNNFLKIYHESLSEHIRRYSPLIHLVKIQ